MGNLFIQVVNYYCL